MEKKITRVWIPDQIRIPEMTVHAAAKVFSAYHNMRLWRHLHSPIGVIGTLIWIMAPAAGAANFPPVLYNAWGA
jgi:hypothetical protein